MSYILGMMQSSVRNVARWGSQIGLTMVKSDYCGVNLDTIGGGLATDITDNEVWKLMEGVKLTIDALANQINLSNM